MKLPIDPAELIELEHRFGPLPRRPVHLKLTPISRKHWWPLLERERRAEVVLIMPRPSHRLVVIRKPDYPPGVFRFPTGGIGPDEDVLTAATREVAEETGLEVEPERLLAVIDWTFAHQGQERRFASYLSVFPITTGPLQARDLSERISEYGELSLAEIETLAATLERLPGPWQNWGFQRAVPHRAALELLRKTELLHSPIDSR